jgi:hypothetical protein
MVQEIVTKERILFLYRELTDHSVLEGRSVGHEKFLKILFR